MQTEHSSAAARPRPSDSLSPNAETIEAMQAADRDELIVVGDVRSLMAELNADD